MGNKCIPNLIELPSLSFLIHPRKFLNESCSEEEINAIAIQNPFFFLEITHYLTIRVIP